MVEPIVKRASGLDVHKKSVVASLVLEQEDGTVLQESRAFGTAGGQREALGAWLKENRLERVVMESTGIYWKSVYAALEAAGLKTDVVNARQVRQVPGRKTDVSDSQWLASLTRFGLLKPSFISPKDLRELRLITRDRLKLQGVCSPVRRIACTRCSMRRGCLWARWSATSMGCRVKRSSKGSLTASRWRRCPRAPASEARRAQRRARRRPARTTLVSARPTATPYQSVGRRALGHRCLCDRGNASLSAAVGNSSNYPRH
jgi:hypothetical protein